jgi:molybdopterin-guanine dinucleotide biosynthesis protein A
MGRDKSELNYRGKSQKEVMKELLESQGIETFYSVASHQGNINEIHDVLLNLGPFGGIYSAIQKDSDSAWFVLAIDVPFVNKELVQLLLKNRNPEKMATVVQGKNKEFPEPLIAIYEPKIYSVFEQHLKEGNTSPRDILMNSNIEIIQVEDALIRNINTFEEYELAKKELN